MRTWPGSSPSSGPDSWDPGIAQVSAQAGWDVVLRDVTDAALTRGLDGIKASYDKFVAKGKLEASDAEAALARITTTTDLDAVA
ncbi:hypothetical protein DDE05_55360, partial [Streptomyces cavourensis]